MFPASVGCGDPEPALGDAKISIEAKNIIKISKLSQRCRPDVNLKMYFASCPDMIMIMTNSDAVETEKYLGSPDNHENFHLYGVNNIII